MEPIPFSHLACLSCSENGTTYGVASYRSPSAGLLAVLDVRQCMLANNEPHQEAAEVEQTQVIQTSPPLAFDVHGAVASPNGRYLAISGYDQQEEDQAVLVVVDVYGGQVQPIPPSVSQRHRAKEARRQQHEAPLPPLLKVKQCAPHQVDYQLFASRKGLVVRQVAWHPHSEAHLVVLTSDNCLRLYHLSDLSMAEQTFHLQVNGPGTTGFGLSAAAYAVDATAFAFGPASAWGFFTVYILASSGAVYGLCPVAPFGMPCPVSALSAALADAAEAGEGKAGDAQHDELGDSEGQGGTATGRAWLTLAFGTELEAAAVAGGTGMLAMPRLALPHASPTLQGPLNAGAASAQLGTGRAVALCAMHQLSAVPGPQPDGRLRMQVLTTLTSATAQGTVYAHVLPALLRPAWAGLPPYTAVARGAGRPVGRGVGGYRGGGWALEGGEDEDILVSVKMECECLGVGGPALAGPAAGKGWAAGQVEEGGLQGGLQGGAALLVDVVEMQGGLQGLGLLGSSEDEEEEDGDEEDVEEAGLVVVGRQQQQKQQHYRRRAPRVSATGGYPQRLALLPLQPPQQLGAPGAGGLAPGAPQGQELAVVSAQGCWAVQLPWVPVLAGALARGAGVEQGAGGTADLLPRLPPPVAYELHSARAASSRSGSAGGPAAAPALQQQQQQQQQEGGPSGLVVAACVFHDFFVGQGVVVLQPGAAAPLACLRPQAMPQQAPDEGEVHGAEEDGPTTSTAAAAAAAATSPEGMGKKGDAGGTQKGEDVVGAMIRAQYADLLAGAKAVAPPAGGYRKETGAAPAGKETQQQGGGATDAEFLHSTVRALRQGPIQYSHRAHQDLRTRAVQLDGEAQSHAAAVSELEGLRASLAERQQGLAERCAKALRLQRNLGQRTALLTEMHWSIPRPLSIAEQQLQADLDVADLARRDTAAKWAALRKRTEHVLQSFVPTSHDIKAGAATSPALGALLPAPATPSLTPAAGDPSTPSPFSSWGVHPVPSPAPRAEAAGVAAPSAALPPSLARTGELEAASAAAAGGPTGRGPPTPGSLGALRLHPHHTPIHATSSARQRWGLLPLSSAAQPPASPSAAALQQQLGSLQLSSTGRGAGKRGLGCSVVSPSVLAGAAGGVGGGLPSSQQAQVQDRILQHYHAISSCSAHLQRMEAAVQDARALRAEREARGASGSRSHGLSSTQGASCA